MTHDLFCCLLLCISGFLYSWFVDVKVSLSKLCVYCWATRYDRQQKHNLPACILLAATFFGFCPYGRLVALIGTKFGTARTLCQILCWSVQGFGIKALKPWKFCILTIFSPHRGDFLWQFFLTKFLHFWDAYRLQRHSQFGHLWCTGNQIASKISNNFRQWHPNFLGPTHEWRTKSKFCMMIN